MTQLLALAVALLSALWSVCILTFGGIDTAILGIRVRSDDWSDSAIIAAVSLLVFWRMRRGARGGPVRPNREIVAAAFRRWRTADGLAITAILAVATVARLWALPFGLPHPSARPDEDAVGAIAGSFYGGNFRPPGYIYPTFFILIVAAALWLIFVKMPSVLARMNFRLGTPALTMPAERIVARVLSAAAGVASVWLVFRIGDRLFGRAVALVGSAFLALAFLHVRDSHFGVTDIPMTCMVLAGFLAIVKLSESGSTHDLVWAGLLTGLAVATKYNAALLVLPASLAILDDPLRRTVSARLGRLVGFGVLMTIAFVAVCPYAVPDHERFLADMAFNARHLAQGHGADLGRGWVYHVTTTLRHGLGVPLFASGVAGLPLMVWRERRRGVLVALFPIAYYLLIGNGRTVFARYILPVVPFLCLTAGYAVVTLAAWATDYMRRPGWRVPATATLTAAVLWPSVTSVIAFDRLLAQEDTRVTARRWIEARFPPGAAMAQIGPSNAHVYVDYEKDYVLSDTLTAERPTLVVIVSSPMTESPDLASVAPWLEREYDLPFAEMVVDEHDRANTYDLQDEFFMPLGGFHQIERPGPNIRIFVRRDAPTRF